jgi:hypothetical protein
MLAYLGNYGEYTYIVISIMYCMVLYQTLYREEKRMKRNKDFIHYLN